ncbi:unnamed protein product [Prunus armeniaca]
MAPKKSKAPKVSADAPDWIFGRGVAEYVKEFQVALAQEQTGSLVDEMMPKYKDKWMQNGVFYAIMLSKHQIDLNARLLDMAALFGFKPCGMSIDVLGDYELKNCRIETLMKAIRIEILNKFIFPNADEGVTLEYMHLAEALHNEMGVATCPFILASLYHCLHQITINPLNLNVCGPIWMSQMWLEWYFLELGNDALEFLEDDVPAIALAINPLSSLKSVSSFSESVGRERKKLSFVHYPLTILGLQREVSIKLLDIGRICPTLGLLFMLI